jgi:hypothetical protein
MGPEAHYDIHHSQPRTYMNTSCRPSVRVRDSSTLLFKRVGDKNPLGSCEVLRGRESFLS